MKRFCPSATNTASRSSHGLRSCAAQLGTDTIPKLAEKYGKTEAQIFASLEHPAGESSRFRKSKNPGRLAQNIDVFDFLLEPADIELLNSMNENRRTSHDP